MEYPASILELELEQGLEPRLEPEPVVKRRGRQKGYQVTQATKDKIAATRKNRKTLSITMGNMVPQEEEGAKNRQKRCPNGTRRNKRTGDCEAIPQHPDVPLPAQLPGPLPLNRKRCPKGTRKNKRTGECEKININQKRCPKGTRKNKFTGFCEPVNVNIQPEPELDENEVANIQPDGSFGSFQEASLPSEIPSPLQNQESSTPQPEPVEPESEPVEPQPELGEPQPDASSEKPSTPESYKQPAKPEDEDAVQLYPEPGNPNFNEIIANKREFHEVRHDKMDEFTVEEYANRICSETETSVFELAPHQLFARNFLSALTPYKSLLLYHGLGTGKTCSAICVAEEMRDYMKEMGVNKRIYVIAAPTIRLNFKQQLYNESKLVLNRTTGEWTMNTCVGKKLLKELRIKPVSADITDVQEARIKASILARIKSLIQRTYSFIGYEKLRLVIEETLFGKGKLRNPENDILNLTDVQKQRIQSRFDDTLIIIDEVHNLRTTGENESDDAKMTGKLLTVVARHTRNMRMLLLTATPMYNSPKEILWLINLMRINDNRPEVAYNKVFVGSGTDETIRTATDEDASRSAYSSGKEVLKNASYGYISYVKGENPFTFPYRIYPKDHSPECSFFSEGGNAVPFPTVNFDNVPYPASDIAKETRFLDIYLTPIGKEQQRVYDSCIQRLKSSRGQPDEPAEAGEVDADSDSDANNSDSDSENEDSNTDSHSETPKEEPEAEEAKKKLKPKPTKPTKPTYDEVGTKFGFKSRNALQALTMTFPGSDSDEKMLVGQSGFKQVMTSAVTSKNGQDVVKYSYKDGVERVFARENIGKWSNKIASVCKHAEECDGIVLVYTEYIEGGAVPVALALEEHGFRRYGGKDDNLLTNPTPSTEQPPSKKPKPCYTLITGNKMLTPTSVVSVATAKNNAKGQVIKVIVITKAGSEGIDLKNIRQVHVIDPWYNLSLIEQVIGRAVRNCSHVDLPFEQRNVCIFIHGTRLLGEGEGRDTVEAIDVSLLHHAENKAKRIGNVNRILKKNAVDCNLNKGYNVPQFKDGNSVVRQVLTTFSSSSHSNPVVIERYDVQMKPRTDACDYQDECDFGCEPLIADDELQSMGSDMDTYNMKFLELNSERVIHRVRALFKERFFYTEDELFRHINQVRTYPDEQIMVAIHTLITDPYEILTDGYGRSGRLVQIGNYYLFQPDGITNPKIGLRERAMPVKEGVDAIQVDVQQQQQQQQQLGIDAQKAQSQVGKLYGKYKILLESISSIPMSASTELKDEFILYASKFMKKLTEVGIANRETMLRVGLSHYLDMLSLEDMKQLANRQRNHVAAAEFEELLDKYIEQCAFPCTTSNPDAQTQILISTTHNLTSWTDTSDNKVKPRNEDTADNYVHNYVKRMLETKVEFIARAHKDKQWKDSSTELADPTLSTLRACVSNWVLSSLNLPLVRSTGKDTVYDGVPYKVGCLRWSSAKSEHEFILVDLKIQKSVIHGQVPTKKPEVVQLLQSILGSKGHTLETFIKEKEKEKENVGERGREGEQQESIKKAKAKAKGDVKETIQGLIVFTELLLRVLDIQKIGEKRWMLRPCELQLVTKVGSISHANK
jgi:hypothetical protein